MKRLFNLFLTLILVMSCFSSCGETENTENPVTDDSDIAVSENIQDTQDTQDTHTYDETLSIETDAALDPLPVPENLMAAGSFFSSIAENGKCVENKIYIHRELAGFWEKDPSKIFSVKIEPIEWFEISSAYDTGYWELRARYIRTIQTANAYAEMYAKNPTIQNKNSYDELREEVQLLVDALNGYPQMIEERKNEELATHFRNMGIDCEISGNGVSLNINMEQLLTLSDLHFVAFLVWEHAVLTIA